MSLWGLRSMSALAVQCKCWASLAHASGSLAQLPPPETRYTRPNLHNPEHGWLKCIIFTGLLYKSNAAIDSCLYIFYMYGHICITRACVCVCVQICISISLQSHFIKMSLNNILPATIQSYPRHPFFWTLLTGQWKGSKDLFLTLL